MLFCVATLAALSSAALPGQRDALMSLFRDTGGATTWIKTDGWGAGDPCGPPAWHGVQCRAGAVIALKLRRNGLDGAIPAALGGLGPGLQALTISENVRGWFVDDPELLHGLHPCQAYAELKAGTATRDSVHLADTSLLGKHSEYSKARTGGRVYQCKFFGGTVNGPLPALALAQLTGLRLLDLNNNRLSGTWGESVSALRDLRILQLDGNALGGELPGSLGGLARLQQLRADENHMSGPLPPQLGRLQHLRFLWLNGNRFTGTLPAAWGGLASVKFIDVSDNTLSGGVPKTFAKLKELRHLEMHSGDDTDGNKWSEAHADHEALLELKHLVLLTMNIPRSKLHPKLHKAHFEHQPADDRADIAAIMAHLHDSSFFAFGKKEDSARPLVDAAGGP